MLAAGFDIRNGAAAVVDQRRELGLAEPCRVTISG